MRRIAVLLAAVLALGLAACGGDDDGGSTGTDARVDAAAPGGSGGRTGADGSSDGGDADAAPPSADGPPPSAAREAPSAEIRGDGSIQRYGERASDGDFDDAVPVAEEYFAAMRGRDWERACSLLAGRLTDRLEQLGRNAPAGQGDGCAALLQRLVGTGGADRLDRAYSGVRFTDMRVEGDTAFLLLRASHIEAGAIPMAREDGDWRVAGLEASPL